eukprot:scaffold207199_cov31-Tisochrysis_lutea.AAC.1
MAPDDTCAEAVKALYACKGKIGLLPKQCYPLVSYRGECDGAEHELKRCLAFAAYPEAASVLYDTSRSREARRLANQKIQRKMKRNHSSCHL